MNTRQELPFPWLFLGLTFAISWALWIPAALSGKSTADLPTAPLYLLGGFGPSIAAILLLSLRSDPQTRHDFWRRVIDFSRIRPLWYLLIFLLIPLVTVAAYGFDMLLGGGPYSFPNAATLAQPAALIGTLILSIVAGPLSEELGWRGYALDRIQTRLAPLPAALLLGLLWWAWHLPLYFIRGTSHNTWGLFSPLSLLFLLNVLPLSVFISWAYNHNRRSTLAAILIHFVFNFIFGLVFPVPFRVELIRFIFLSLSVAAIVLATRRTKLDRVK